MARLYHFNLPNGWRPSRQDIRPGFHRGVVVSRGSHVIDRTGADSVARDGDDWGIWLARLRTTEWRTPIFFEIVSREIGIRSGARRPTVLDIGCGLGFDCEMRYQQALS
jgi:hypothetical protein